MGWFSELMFGKDKYNNPTLQPDKPWPRGSDPTQSGVILPQSAVYTPEKDISEPVYAIVAAMKTRPSTFKLSKVEKICDEVGCIYKYSITDIKTKQVLNICQSYGFRGDTLYDFSWKWLTEDEKKLLVTVFTEILEHKINRIKFLQRAKMKGIYK